MTREELFTLIDLAWDGGPGIHNNSGHMSRYRIPVRNVDVVLKDVMVYAIEDVMRELCDMRIGECREPALEYLITRKLYVAMEGDQQWTTFYKHYRELPGFDHSKWKSPPFG